MLVFFLYFDKFSLLADSFWLSMLQLNIFIKETHTLLWKWLLKRELNDVEIKDIKEEQLILTKGVLACLKGLKEQGCDGPVTSAISEIEDHINKQAHK